MEVDMKMVKSLLLGTAAGLVAVTGAQAADLPVKAKPVLYVKICSLYGDGFYYIPGTDTCLKMGGYVRVQAEYNMGAGGIADGSGSQTAQARYTRDLTNDVDYRSRGAISWDVRQQTEYGTLRTYIRTGIQVTTPTDTESGAVFWDRAFIQFAGFTVGKTQSFFDLFTYGGGMSYHNVRTSGDTGAAGVTVWGYTAQFGNGFSGTLSAESPIGHNRHFVLDVNQNGFFALNGVALSDNAFSQQALVGQNGFRMPDVIANLRVDQAWGFVGVSAAIHDASGAYFNSVGANACGAAVVGFGPNCVDNGHPADKLGWAVAVGGLLNLGGGDQAGVNFAYAEGATGYVTNAGGMSIYDSSSSLGVGWFSDGVFANGTEIELTRAWSVNAGYQHIWNPKWRTSIFGGYVNIDYGSNATALICANRVRITQFAAVQPVGFNCSPDFSFFEIGTRTQWNPVPQLDIGLEILYSKLNTAFSGPANLLANGSRPACTNSATNACSVDDQDVWSAMFRWQRNFYP
jgi:Porin subfamily